VALSCNSSPATEGVSGLQRRSANDMNKKLTAEEERVIVNKGTEPPFTGYYLNNEEDGTYTCKRCGAELFESADKFDTGCGWPSFDDAIPDAVAETTDADGMRTEITCAKCGAHLGHVFKGEELTDKNTRHCVNSISLDFEPAAGAEAEAEQTERAIFAGGCFWGVEYHFETAPGVISAVSGYIGGEVDNPSYEQVCGKRTGHAEAVEIVYDPTKTSYEELARIFFEIHDPTQLDRQGPDVGDQYRSAVYYTSEAQREIAERLIGLLRDKGHEVVTEVVAADKFWAAGDYHQDYYERKGSTPYCHSRVKRF